MRIDFEPEHHIYSVNGEIANTSVTELLAKHGLAPSYSGVSKEKLKATAEIGKEVHKDLEQIINDLDHIPTTEQGKQFREWAKMNLQNGIAEQVVGFEREGFSIAGTVDFLGTDIDGDLIIGDHKNTSKFHREYVSWQVSLYDYFLRRLRNEKVNGVWFRNWTGAKKFYCFHYNPKTAKMTIYELEKIADEEIEKLIECERKGEKYQRPQLYLDKDIQERFILAEQLLLQKETEYKQAEETAKEIREEIKKAFEKQHVLSWESPNKKVKITYVHKREGFAVDQTKLRREYPLVYEKVVKPTSRSAYIQIKLKGENKNETEF